MQRLAPILMLAGSVCLVACHSVRGADVCFIPDDDLGRVGVYVVHNLGCTIGCDQVHEGDVIQKIDGRVVETSEDFDAANIADGIPHLLSLLTPTNHVPKTVQVLATPGNEMPPLQDTPPFWTVGTEALDMAPPWARRRMFGHASPKVMLVGVDGGTLDGRQLYGTKRLIVYWDRDDDAELAVAIAFMQVLQKAQADLRAKEVDVLFVHARFPTGRWAAMDDAELRALQDRYAVTVEGHPSPSLPMYRFPNETELDVAAELGMEDPFSVIENLGRSPAIVLLDERGIVRWHSEGVVAAPPGAAVSDPAQHTIIAAVAFALERM